ncbi:MAG: hypothetical protein IJB34_04440 [Clostridia bacterium]|nr:hypothetical protein [Clostridia bacterium]
MFIFFIVVGALGIILSFVASPLAWELLISSIVCLLFGLKLRSLEQRIENLETQRKDINWLKAENIASQNQMNVCNAKIKALQKKIEELETRLLTTPPPPQELFTTESGGRVDKKDES